MALRGRRPLGKIPMPPPTKDVAGLGIGWNPWTLIKTFEGKYRVIRCKTANTTADNYDVVGGCKTARRLIRHPQSISVDVPTRIEVAKTIHPG